MKLISLKCPSCGAKLEVNEELEKFTCTYCGITTLLDDEVKKVKIIHSDLEQAINELKELEENSTTTELKKQIAIYYNKYPKNEIIIDYYEKYFCFKVREGFYYFLKTFLYCVLICLVILFIYFLISSEFLISLLSLFFITPIANASLTIIHKLRIKSK